ncbi:hypothetical protein Esti_006232 [Eimeria stiedai]
MVFFLLLLPSQLTFLLLRNYFYFFFFFCSLLAIPGASALRSTSPGWAAFGAASSPPSPQLPNPWGPPPIRGAPQARSLGLPSYRSLGKASSSLARRTSCKRSTRLLSQCTRGRPPLGGPPALSAANWKPQLGEEPRKTAVEAGGPPGVPSQGGHTPARKLRLEALRKAKENEENVFAFPVALRIPHPELVGGMTYRRLGGPSAQNQRQQQQQQQEGPLVSSLCVGTSMIGGNVMQDDKAALRMLCTAYEEYGINFYDVGELDPIPYAPQSHGSGHRGVLREFFRKYKAAGDSSSGGGSSSSKKRSRGCAAAGHEENAGLRAEASRLFVSVRLLSGSLGSFDFERFALERQRREAAAAAAARAAAAAGADATRVAAAAAAAGQAAAAAVHGDLEGNTRWARAPGWWARGPQGHVRLQLTERHLEGAVDEMLQRLGVESIDLLQLTEPHRYVPRHELGEDTYCWGLERHDTVPIETQLEMLAGLVRKGKVRFLGLSNETAYGIFKWVEAAEELKLPRLVASQHLYNLLHRNELESAGIPEIAYRLGVPVVAYGALAGGVLTGKYLDPERFHSKGADVRPGQDELESGVGTYRYQIPEDFGYLSFGPSTGRANLWPSTYHTHRWSVWGQWLMGELIKTGRRFGMTAAQLALSWVFSRPFVASTIIGPRTIGQLRESVRAQNYVVDAEVSRQLHELYLHYPAPTMGGPQLLTQLPDSERRAQPPLSQSDFMKWGKQPIWSGGTYWANWPLPLLPEKVEYLNRKELAHELRGAAGALDDPSDEGVINLRLWRERLDEGLPGEYFAVKEQQLFGWDEHTIAGLSIRNTTEIEKQQQHHMDWHLCWKGGTLQRVPTTSAMRAFYQNRKAVSEVIHKNFKSFKDLTIHREQLGKLVPELWNRIDYDLFAKMCKEKHNIDILHPEARLSSFCCCSCCTCCRCSYYCCCSSRCRCSCCCLWEDVERGPTNATRAEHERSDLERFRTKCCSHSSQQQQQQQQQHQQQCGFGAARCNYSHNTHWTRRCPVYLKEPSALRYLPYLCSNVLLGPRETIQDNWCPYGAFCPFAHSKEELVYHPLVYKLKPCAAHRYGRCKAFYCWKAHGPLDIRIPRAYTIPAKRNVPLPHVPGVTVVHSLAAAMAAAAEAAVAAAAAAPAAASAPEAAQGRSSAFAAAGQRRPTTQQLGTQPQQQQQQQQRQQQRRLCQEQPLLQQEPQQRLQQRMQRQLRALHCSWENLPSLSCSSSTSRSIFKGSLKSFRCHCSSSSKAAASSLAAALRSRQQARRCSVQHQQQQHLQQLQQQQQHQHQQQRRPRRLLRLHQMLQGGKRLRLELTCPEAAAKGETDWTPTGSSSSSSSSSSKQSGSCEARKRDWIYGKRGGKFAKTKVLQWPKRLHRKLSPAATAKAAAAKAAAAAARAGQGAVTCVLVFAFVGALLPLLLLLLLELLVLLQRGGSDAAAVRAAAAHAGKSARGDYLLPQRHNKQSISSSKPGQQKQLQQQKQQQQQQREQQQQAANAVGWLGKRIEPTPFKFSASHLSEQQRQRKEQQQLLLLLCVLLWTF